MATSRVAVETLEWLIEQAFDGDPHQSLIANLRRLRGEDWNARPTRGERFKSVRGYGCRALFVLGFSVARY